MNKTFGFSLEHGKRKLAAAIALLLVAISLAAAPAVSSIEAGRKPAVHVTGEIQTTSFSIRGSTWG